MTGSSKDIWTRLDSGVLARTGHTSSASSTSNATYLDGKEKALKLLKFYEDNDVPLPTGCDLASHIKDAIALSDSWILGTHSKVSSASFFRAVHLDKIADAFECLEGHEARRRYLSDVASGTVDAFDRAPSHAKNILWEMELCSIIRRHDFPAVLGEPDIVVGFAEADVGIACKRIYSEENIEKTLSQGVAQIERHHAYGLLAINIDDLAPPNTIRTVASPADLGASLSEDNRQFLSRHDRHFRKYLSTGRAMGAFVASGGIAWMGGTPVNSRQGTMWLIPGLVPEKECLMRQLERGLTA